MMNKSFIALSLCCAMGIPSLMAQVSPNGLIRAEYQQEKGLVISYNIEGEWQEIMTLESDKSVQSKPDKNRVSYDMLTGKRKHCTNQYNESLYRKKSGDKEALIVRVYNDGVAWSGIHDYQVDFSASTNNWLMRWTDCYEEFYPKNREWKEGFRVGYPALFEFKNDIFALLSESCIRTDNAGTSMYELEKQGSFALRPDGPEMGGFQTLILGTLSDVVESTLITDNSDNCKNSNPSWVQPGLAAWVYWAYNHGSNDCNIIQQYTDMAVALHLPYVLIDAEWDEMKDGKTVEDAVKYAVSKGIRPMIWYNSSVGWINGAPGPKFRLNKKDEREKEFAWCESIGVKGVKIDFFSGDNNMNIKYMAELLESAAKYHLLVNFHGATIPRGWQRTYPNLVSVEAVYGAEWYNNVPHFTDRAAAHNATLPFTRNVIGSMDYTPCAFTDSQHPHITTHAHELALTTLYESGITHLADRPESFLSQPKEIQNYLTFLPTTWDETVLLGGYPGESVIIARRKENRWYIAGINGTNNAKTLAFELKRLKGLGSRVMIYEDGGTAARPWRISTSRRLVTSFICKPRGGFVMVIE